jgi:hypothetical protein
MALHAPVGLDALEYSDAGSMRKVPNDGETASIVRGKERRTFYLLNAGLVHVYVRPAGNFLHRRSFGTYSILK